MFISNSEKMNKNITNQFAKMFAFEYSPLKHLISSAKINEISKELECIYNRYTTDYYTKSIFEKFKIIFDNEIMFNLDDSTEEENEVYESMDNMIMNIMNILSDSQYNEKKNVDNLYIALETIKFLELASFNYSQINKHINHPLIMIQPMISQNYVDHKVAISVKKYDSNGSEKEISISLPFDEIKNLLTEEADEIHFFFTDAIRVLVKHNDKVVQICFDIKTFDYFLDLAINDKDSEYMSKIISYATSKTIYDLDDYYKNKVIKYINMVNERNILIFSKNKNKSTKLPAQDITKYIINKYINPEVEPIFIVKELQIKISSMFSDICERMIIDSQRILYLPYRETEKIIENNIKYLLDNLDLLHSYEDDNPYISIMKINMKRNKIKLMTILFEYLHSPVCKKWIYKNENFKKSFIDKSLDIKLQIESSSMTKKEKYLLKLLNESLNF